ncbi:MAG: T9SS type A sorting domain-containing protein, partial [Bacteroidota bacterium]
LKSNQHLLAIEGKQSLPYSHQEISIFEGDSIFLADAFQTEAGVYHHFTQDEAGNDILLITRLLLEPAPVETFDEITFTAAPNPFTNTTQLEYTLPTDSPVKIQVYDAMGRQLGTLQDTEQAMGKHFVDFNAEYPSGVYVVQLIVGASIRTLSVIKVE